MGALPTLLPPGRPPPTPHPPRPASLCRAQRLSLICHARFCSRSATPRQSGPQSRLRPLERASPRLHPCPVLPIFPLHRSELPKLFWYVGGVKVYLEGGLKTRVRKFGRKRFHSDRCKREYRQYRTWVEAGKWGVPGVEPIWVARLGKRASGSAAAWQAPRAGHPLQHMFTRYVPDATPPR
jgi:hypothetical protein